MDGCRFQPPWDEIMTIDFIFEQRMLRCTPGSVSLSLSLSLSLGCLLTKVRSNHHCLRWWKWDVVQLAIIQNYSTRGPGEDRPPHAGNLSLWHTSSKAVLIKYKPEVVFKGLKNPDKSLEPVTCLDEGYILCLFCSQRWKTPMLTSKRCLLDITDVPLPVTHSM